MRFIMAEVVTILSLACPVFAADDSLKVWADTKDDVAKAATSYLDAFSTVGEREKWKKNIKERMEERPLQAIALDWFFDHQGELQDKDPDAVKTACMFFLLFVETRTPPPSQIRTRITRENMEAMAEFLRDEVEFKKG